MIPFQKRLRKTRARCGALLLVLGLLLPAPAAAALQLLEIPRGLKRQGDPITLRWKGAAGRVHLRATTAPGQNRVLARYDSLHLPSQLDSGQYTFRINPDIPTAYRATDLRYGTNYCILTDGTEASAEFAIIVESDIAPALAAPVSGAVLKDPAPVFSWTGTAPYYTVLVSDEPFSISEDQTVEGISAIWQIITPFTSARYGDPDPTGALPVAAPPLVAGKTYNWLVLNNYGATAAATSKVAPNPQSFTYAPALSLASPALIEPRDRDTLAGSNSILFRWSKVANASSYKVEILEENLIEGSQADVVIWKANTTAEEARLDDAASFLRRYQYKWRVYALGPQGEAAVSGKRHFFFDIPVGTLGVTLADEAGAPIAFAPLRIARIGSTGSIVLQSASTSAGGTAEVEKTSLGRYEVRAENIDGFLGRVDTVDHLSTQGTRHNMVLKAAQGQLAGRVLSKESGAGLLNARLTFTSDRGRLTTRTNSQGQYALSLPTGSWTVTAEADEHESGAPVFATLSAANPSRTADFSLARLPFSVSGSVVNAVTRAGIYGAVVTFAQGGQSLTRTTDGRGAFSFSAGAGNAKVTVSCPGFAVPEPEELAVNGNRSITLALEPGASLLAGKARDLSQTPLRGTVIVAEPRFGPAREIEVDGSGAFELSLPSGDWTLRTRHPAFQGQAAARVLLDKPRTLSGFDFLLAPAGALLQGRAVSGGQGLGQVEVRGAGMETRSAADGYFSLPVPAGALSLSGALPGYAFTALPPLVVGPGDTLKGLSLSAVPAGSRVQGTVTGPGGFLSHAQVLAKNRAGGEARLFHTTAEGRFDLALPPGEYELEARKEGYEKEGTLTLNLLPGSRVPAAALRVQPFRALVEGEVSGGGRAVSGCRVDYAAKDGAERKGFTLSDAAGRYALSLEAGAAYDLTAFCEGFLPSRISTGTLTAGATESRGFSLSLSSSTVRGKVVSASGAPLGGVLVRAEAPAGQHPALETGTLFDGTYALKLGVGSYRLRFLREGYSTRFRDVPVSSGPNPSLLDTLTGRSGEVRGLLLSRGQALPSALVSFTEGSGSIGRSVFSGEDGRYLVTGLPAGSYRIRASAPGHADLLNPSFLLAEGQVQEWNGTLLPLEGRLRGKALDAEGKPLAGVSISVSSASAARSLLTAEDGTFEAAGLPAGTYRADASLTGYSTDQSRSGLALSPGGLLEGLDFKLSRNSGNLAGTVSGADRPEGISLSFLSASGLKLGAACDREGRFALAAVPEGDYTVSLAAPGYRLAGPTQNPKVGVGKSSTLSLSLVPAAYTLSGRVANQDGESVAGLAVELRAGPADLRKSSTAADGSFRFEGLPLAEAAAGSSALLSLRSLRGEFENFDTAFTPPGTPGAVLSLSLRALDRTASLSGRLSLDGKPAEGFRLEAGNSLGRVSALSQPDGSFLLERLAGSRNEPLRLRLRRPGMTAVDTTLALGRGEAKSGLSFTLRALAVKVTGRLASETGMAGAGKDEAGIARSGKPLAAGKVLLLRPGRTDTALTDASGLFSFAGIPGNGEISIVTALNPKTHDNLERKVEVGERDTALALDLPVHATRIGVRAEDEDGAPLSGVDVFLNRNKAGSAAAGRLDLEYLAAGVYDLAVEKAGYERLPARRLALPGDTAVTEDFRLKRLETGLVGLLTDSGFAGEPPRALGGVVVALISGGDSLFDTTSLEGRFAFVSPSALGAGKAVSLHAALPGYFPARAALQSTGGVDTRNLRMTPLPGALLGRITDSLGRGAAGAALELLRTTDGALMRARAGEGGYYAFDALMNQVSYKLTAASGRAEAIRALTGSGSSARRHDLLLKASAAFRGKVVLREGTDAAPAASARPAAFARVDLLPKDGGEGRTVFTDSNGLFLLRSLPDGRYGLGASLPGFVPEKDNTVISFTGSAASAKGDTALAAELVLVAREPGLSGRLLSAAGRSLEGLLRVKGEGDSLEARCDPAGFFFVPLKKAGAYALTASAPGFKILRKSDLAFDGRSVLSLPLSLTPEEARLSGTVRDAFTNLPLAQVEVTVEGKPDRAVQTDADGRYTLPFPAGESRLELSLKKPGYLEKSGIPFERAGGGAEGFDLVLTADYRFDGNIAVTVAEEGRNLPGLALALKPFFPGDSLKTAQSALEAVAFTGLRRPSTYLLTTRREGFPDLSKSFTLEAGTAPQNLVLRYPSSRLEVQLTADGKTPLSAQVAIAGAPAREDEARPGLFTAGSRLKRGSYSIGLSHPNPLLLDLEDYEALLGEDSLRLDSVRLPFTAVRPPDSTIGAPLSFHLLSSDTLRSLSAGEEPLCSLFYRHESETRFTGLALQAGSRMPAPARAFSVTLPSLARPGTYTVFFRVRHPKGGWSRIVSGEQTTTRDLSLLYSNRQKPLSFTLRDPYLLHSIALLPQRLESDTSVYTLRGKDRIEVALEGDRGLSLDAHFDRMAAEPKPEGGDDEGYAVTAEFLDPARAEALGCRLESEPGRPRAFRFLAGAKPTTAPLLVRCEVRMKRIRLAKTFAVKVEDLDPERIEIKYVKENRVLEAEGSPLFLPNQEGGKFAFAAQARTKTGRIFSISPRFSFGADSSVGSISAQGIFQPRAGVARSAFLRIRDTLNTWDSTANKALPRVFETAVPLVTFAQVVPAGAGEKVVEDGDGTRLRFNLAGLAKGFRVSVMRAAVSELLLTSPNTQVVGEVREIELSEAQPFKADSGAHLTLPVGRGEARGRKVYLGHWLPKRQAWEKVDSAMADSAVGGLVKGFSKYAVLMGSGPLGAYDFKVLPNPFSPRDPFGLQLSYRVDSEVSSQVAVKVEVFNMNGDKVYESREMPVSKARDPLRAATDECYQTSSDPLKRLTTCGPFLWDGRTTEGRECRNGRYLLKLSVRDGKGHQEYLRKVVLIK